MGGFFRAHSELSKVEFLWYVTLSVEGGDGLICKTSKMVMDTRTTLLCKGFALLGFKADCREIS